MERTLTAGAGVLTRTMLALTLAMLGAALILGAGQNGETRKALGLALLPLYVLGLTCAQMLVEVAGRYHYSLIPVLLLLGQAAFFPPAPAETKNFQKNRESP